MDYYHMCLKIIEKELTKFNLGTTEHFAFECRLTALFPENFDVVDNRCTYMSCYATIGIYAFKDSLTKFLLGYPKAQDLVYEWKSQSEVNVCSLSTGPGLDYLAFVLSILEFDPLPPKFNGAKVLSKYSGWQNTLNLMLEVFREQDLMFGVTLSRLNYENVKVIQIEDLMKCFSNQSGPLKSMHIVLMMNALSLCAYGLADEKYFLQVLKDMLVSLRPNATIFFLDTTHNADLFRQALSCVPGTYLYGPIHQTSTIPFNYSEAQRNYPVAQSSGTFLVWRRLGYGKAVEIPTHSRTNKTTGVKGRVAIKNPFLKSGTKKDEPMETIKLSEILPWRELPPGKIPWGAIFWKNASLTSKKSLNSLMALKKESLDCHWVGEVARLYQKDYGSPNLSTSSSSTVVSEMNNDENTESKQVITESVGIHTNPQTLLTAQKIHSLKECINSNTKSIFKDDYNLSEKVAGGKCSVGIAEESPNSSQKNYVSKVSSFKTCNESNQQKDKLKCSEILPWKELPPGKIPWGAVFWKNASVTTKKSLKSVLLLKKESLERHWIGEVAKLYLKEYGSPHLPTSLPKEVASENGNGEITVKDRLEKTPLPEQVEENVSGPSTASDFNCKSMNNCTIETTDVDIESKAEKTLLPEVEENVSDPSTASNFNCKSTNDFAVETTDVDSQSLKTGNTLLPERIEENASGSSTTSNFNFKSMNNFRVETTVVDSQCPKRKETMLPLRVEENVNVSRKKVIYFKNQVQLHTRAPINATEIGTVLHTVQNWEENCIPAVATHKNPGKSFKTKETQTEFPDMSQTESNQAIIKALTESVKELVTAFERSTYQKWPNTSNETNCHTSFNSCNALRKGYAEHNHPNICANCGSRQSTHLIENQACTSTDGCASHDIGTRNRYFCLCSSWHCQCCHNGQNTKPLYSCSTHCHSRTCNATRCHFPCYGQFTCSENHNYDISTSKNLVGTSVISDDANFCSVNSQN